MKERDGGWRVRFFPQKQAGFVSIDLATLGIHDAAVAALDADGEPVEDSFDKIEKENGILTIRHSDPQVWSFRLLPAERSAE